MHLIEAKEILSAQNGMNVYRGCTHGCIYCDSRSRCYQFDHSFEDIAVKANAPTLLEQALKRKRKPCMIYTGSMCDPYLPLERELRVTRRCLECIERYGFGVDILTKSDHIMDDIELLSAIHERARCVVQMTVTTYDDALCKAVEPNVCSTSARFAVLQAMRERGIPTIVWLSPILPYINDTTENIDAILRGCAETGVAGILSFGMGVTLREGSREYFYAQLDKLFPGMRSRYEKRFGYTYVCGSDAEDLLMRRAADFCSAKGMMFGEEALFAWMRQMPQKELRLF